MHFLGLAGMPRRIPDYALQFTDFNMIATIGAVIFGLSQIFFIYIEVNKKCEKKSAVEFAQEISPSQILIQYWINLCMLLPSLFTILQNGQ